MRDSDVPLALGTTDAELHVERISSDVEQLFGVAPEEVAGRSVVTLVDERDAPTMLLAIADATQSGRGVTFRARCRLARDSSRSDGHSLFMVVPLDPPPSVGFMVLTGDDVIDPDASQAHLQRLMIRFARTIDAAATSRDTGRVDRNDHPVPLSTRELEIVGRLLAGDRVPAIGQVVVLQPEHGAQPPVGGVPQVRCVVTAGAD